MYKTYKMTVILCGCLRTTRRPTYVRRIQYIDIEKFVVLCYNVAVNKADLHNGKRLTLNFGGCLPSILNLGGGAMEQYYPVILFLVIATGYIISIKNNRPYSQSRGYFLRDFWG